MSTKHKKVNYRKSLKLNVLLACLLITALFGGIGTWSAVASIAGAVIASGKVVVATNSKKVQHSEGGIVSKIEVAEGDLVQQGDLLLRLDDTLSRAALAIIQKQIDELIVQRARLIVERDGHKEVLFAEKATRAGYSQHDYEELVENEKELFVARREERTRRQLRLKEQIGQLQEELRGLEIQLEASQSETILIEDELNGLLQLQEKGLVQKNRVIALRRDKVRIAGRIGDLRAQIAQSKRRANEIEIEISRISDEFRTDVLSGLSEIRTDLNELLENEITALDKLKRLEIRAPRSGYVHELSVHTLGGVIGQGETVMTIVPMGEKLTVEASVSPQDIEQLFVGQKVKLRFVSFNQRTTPEVEATLSKIGADLTTDELTGTKYFKVYVDLGAEQLDKFEDDTIVPGMPVEAYIQTVHRTVISYLSQPLTDHISKAFREN